MPWAAPDLTGLPQDLQHGESEVYDCIQSDAGSPPASQGLLSQVRGVGAASLAPPLLPCALPLIWAVPAVCRGREPPAAEAEPSPEGLAWCLGGLVGLRPTPAPPLSSSAALAKRLTSVPTSVN